MVLSIYDILKLVLPPAVFLATCVIGVPYVKSRPISYQASAKIWIQAQFPSSIGEKDQGGLYLPLSTFFNSPIKTAAELIRSDVVLDQAVDFLKESMPDDKRCPSLEELRDSVKTEEIKDTDVLIVRYTDVDPKRSFLVLEGVLQGFLKLNSTQSSASALRSRKFLEEQLSAAKKDLSQARAQLRKFQTEHGKTDLPQETLTTLHQLSQQELRVEETRAEIARYRQMVAYLESLPQSMQNEAVLAASDDPVLKGIQRRQAEIQLELAQLSSKLKDNHPMIISLKSSADQLKTAMDERMKIYRGGKLPADLEGAPVITTAASPTISDGVRSLTTARKELSGLESVLRAQVQALESLRAKVRKLPEQHTQFVELKHNEEHFESSVSEIENRLDAARQIESVAAGVTNIQIIDRPRIPNIPAGPGQTVLFAATAILGLGGAVGSFFLIQLLNPSVTKPRELGFSLFPVVAALGNLTSARKNRTVIPFDRLRLSLTSRLANTKLIVLLSSNPNEGKTITAAGLAKSFASSGQKVLLVAKDGTGLSSMLDADDADSSPPTSDPVLSAILKPISKCLWLADTGDIDPAWESQEGAILIQQFEKLFDIVIFDTEALSTGANSLGLLKYNVLPLILVRMKRTSKASIFVLVRQLSIQGARDGVMALWDADAEDLADIDTVMPAKPSGEPVKTTDDVWV